MIVHKNSAIRALFMQKWVVCSAPILAVKMSIFTARMEAIVKRIISYTERCVAVISILKI